MVRSGRGSRGPEHQPGGVVQERHVAHQRERAAAVRAGRARRRSRSRRCRRCRRGRGWRSPCGGRRRRTARPSGRGRGSGWRRRRASRPPGGRARLTAPATSYGVRPGSAASSASSCARHATGRPPATRSSQAGSSGRLDVAAGSGVQRAGRPGTAARATTPGVGAAQTSTSARASSRVTGRDRVGWPKTTTRSIRGPSVAVEQQPVAAQRVRRRCGEPLVGSASSGQPARCGQHPRRRPRVVAGDDDGARAGRHAVWTEPRDSGRSTAVCANRRGVRDRAGGVQRSSGTSGSSSWTLRWSGPAAPGRRPASPSGTPAARSRVGDERAEDADLVGGLVGAGAAQPRRAGRR